jgi:hypothetical protein
VPTPTPTPTSTDSHQCDSDSGQPSGGCVATIRILSIVPSETTAKIGDNVSFTVTAENDGPDAVEVWMNASPASMFTCPEEGQNTEGCMERGALPAGQTRTLTGVEVIPPTTGSFTETGCAWSLELTSPQVCKSVTIPMNDQPCPRVIPGDSQTYGNQSYTMEGEDTFTKDAPLGSFASNDYNQVVYTGDHGMGWTEYPDGWKSTNSGTFEGYEPSTVQSVHDGVLDFDLHNVLDSANLDHPVGASISPQPAGNRYQTYGAWSFCERVPPDPVTGPRSDQLFGFHQAPLLWPMDTPASPAPDSVWKASESDFPESDLAESALDFTAFAHYGGQGAQDIFRIPSDMVSGAVGDFDPTQWNVYTQTWGPGFRSYFVNGQLVGTTTNQVYSDPERWQLQFEPAIPPNGTPWGSNPGPVANEGHVWIKWVWIGKLG